MRILVISQHYPPAVNGFAIQCADTARGLHERGHVVRILTGRHDAGSRGDQPAVARIFEVSPTEDFKSYQAGYLVRQLRRRRVFRGNARLALVSAEAFKPDVIFVWQFNALGFGLLRGLQRLAAPIILNVADTVLCDLAYLLKEDPHLIWRAARRYLYRARPQDLGFAHLIMPSKELKSHYIGRGFDERQMTVVHNGIDSRYIKKDPPPPGPGNRLLYAGRVHPTKGLETAIDALSLLNSGLAARFSLDVVGEGTAEYVQALAARVRRLGLEASVSFLGPRPRDELLTLYARYDVFLFPSVGLEAFGLTLVEAMSQGVSVVASDRGGPRSIIRHGQDGLLVEPGNPEALAGAVVQLARDTLLRARIAAAGLQKIKDCFTLERHVMGTEAVMMAALEDASAQWGRVES